MSELRILWKWINITMWLIKEGGLHRCTMTSVAKMLVCKNK
jgi:hypothetical protein